MRAARLLVFSVLLAVSGTAAAVQGHAYWGIAYMHSNFDFNAGASYHPEGAVAKLGYDLIGQRIAVELHVGGTRDARATIGGVDTKLSISYAAAAFLRYNVVATDDFRLYAMGGYGYDKIHYQFPGAVYNDTSSGPAYGVGMELYGSQTGAIDIEYLRYIKDGSLNGAKYQLNSLNIGYVHHF